MTLNKAQRRHAGSVHYFITPPKLLEPIGEHIDDKLHREDNREKEIGIVEECF